ncbi:hypothetical protein [Laceyella putida]|uniref:WD40 repeat domain-containing protein n=1 Tax=Laceyella putida TaxID=110101 RepID=A0ABW2RK41_9BACL
MKTNDTEKCLSSPSGLEPGEWCEHIRLPKMVRLHPIKDELFVITESGKLARWRYTPALTFVDGLETSDINDLTFSSDGQWFAVSAPALRSIDIRSTEDLSLLRQIRNAFTNGEYMFSMCLDQDGSWLVIDSCRKPGELDEEEGLAWIHLQTGEAHARTWPEMDYVDPEELGYGHICQMALSPDQKRLAVNEWKEGSAVIHIFPSLLKGHQRTGSLEERQLSQFAWVDINSNVSDLCFHPDSTCLVCFKTTSMDGWKYDHWRYPSVGAGWVGELITISATRREELWRVPIDSRLTGWERGILEGHYAPHGYAGKVLAGETEVVCTTPNGQLLFFDMKTGEFQRKLKVNGNHIYAIGLHKDGDKIRVATDRELQVIEWK